MPLFRRKFSIVTRAQEHKIRSHSGRDIAMKPTQGPTRAPTQIIRNVIALICTALILPGNSVSWAVQAQQPQPAQTQPQGQQQTAGPTGQDKLSKDQLDSLVAPVALYPDALLTQTLMASTYPLEIVQLQQFLEQN